MNRRQFLTDAMFALGAVAAAELWAHHAAPRPPLRKVAGMKPGCGVEPAGKIAVPRPQASPTDPPPPGLVEVVPSPSQALSGDVAPPAYK